MGKIKASTRKKDDVENNKDAPSYTMPLIRRLCRAFSTPLLAPHVYTGTCVVLKFDELWPPNDGSPEPDEESLEEKVKALVIALYVMVLTKMQTASKLTTSVYKATSERAVEVLEYKSGRAGVEEWIRRINRQGYGSAQEWFISVPENVFDFKPHAVGTDIDDGKPDGSSAPEDHEDDLEEQIISSRRRRKITSSVRGAEEADDPEGVLLPGLHTMMHHAVDYLSEERTRAFEVWKKQLLLKLDRMDKTSPVKARKAVAVK